MDIVPAEESYPYEDASDYIAVLRVASPRKSKEARDGAWVRHRAGADSKRTAIRPPEEPRPK